MKDISDWISTLEQYYNMKFINNRPNDFYVDPLYIGLKVTELCNQDCVHCWAGKSTFQPTLKDIKRVMNKINQFNPILFGISGGEPFLREDIFEILNYGISNFYSLEILTNGLLLFPNTIKKLETIMRKTDWVHFSLDGVGDVYNKQRGSETFHQVIDH